MATRVGTIDAHVAAAESARRATGPRCGSSSQENEPETSSPSCARQPTNAGDGRRAKCVCEAQAKRRESVKRATPRCGTGRWFAAGPQEPATGLPTHHTAPAGDQLADKPGRLKGQHSRPAGAALEHPSTPAPPSSLPYPGCPSPIHSCGSALIAHRPWLHRPPSSIAHRPSRPVPSARWQFWTSGLCLMLRPAHRRRA